MASRGVLYGMGNPLLDISATVGQDFLQRYDLKPDNAILADDKHQSLYSDLIKNFPVDYIAGGATQNTIRVAQWLIGTPGATTYTGCIGKDEFGKQLTQKAEGDGVKVNYMIHDSTPTGTCAVLITGKNRSMVANLSAANCYAMEHIDKSENWAYVESAKVIYIGGFFLTVSPETIVKVGAHCADTDKIFSMNLSAPFLCQFFKEPMMKAFPFVDYIFGNESEAAAFAKEQNLGTENLEEVALKMASLPKANSKRSRVVVITQGKDNTIVAKDGKVKQFPIVPVDEDKILDTNGAGDAFVGGFLSQLSLGKSLEDCVRCGMYAASVIIQHSGCTFPEKPDFK
ncbi:uncharacterized protein [Oscarella lobularis]|uniref:uncharacterized protein n=1 Tax=Oscarella lobularis TaxID=121494 RepID=UPI003313E98C